METVFFVVFIFLQQKTFLNSAKPSSFLNYVMRIPRRKYGGQSIGNRRHSTRGEEAKTSGLQSRFNLARTMADLPGTISNSEPQSGHSLCQRSTSPSKRFEEDTGNSSHRMCSPSTRSQRDFFYAPSQQLDTIHCGLQGTADRSEDPLPTLPEAGILGPGSFSPLPTDIDTKLSSTGRPLRGCRLSSFDARFPEFECPRPRKRPSVGIPSSSAGAYYSFPAEGGKNSRRRTHPAEDLRHHPPATAAPGECLDDNGLEAGEKEALCGLSPLQLSEGESPYEEDSPPCIDSQQFVTPGPSPHPSSSAAGPDPVCWWGNFTTLPSPQEPFSTENQRNDVPREDSYISPPSRTSTTPTSLRRRRPRIRSEPDIHLMPPDQASPTRPNLLPPQIVSGLDARDTTGNQPCIQDSSGDFSVRRPSSPSPRLPPTRDGLMGSRAVLPRCEAESGIVQPRLLPSAPMGKSCRIIEPTPARGTGDSRSERTTPPPRSSKVHPRSDPQGSRVGPQPVMAENSHSFPHFPSPPHPALTVDSLLTAFSRSSTNYTIKSIHPSLVLPISNAISAVLASVREAPTSVYHYLEFFIFPLAVLGSMPPSQFRRIRQRNRPFAQRDFTFQRLHLWNTARFQVIQDTLLQPQPLEPQPPRSAIQQNSNLRRAERLIREDGQLGKAVQALHSSGIAPRTSSTIETLRAKHPVSPLPSPSPIPEQTLKVTAKQIFAQLQTFAKGSAGSRSGWRVSHFLQLCQSHLFLSEFTFFVNLFLADRIPRTLARIVVSGSLVPVLKKDGGIRPIVVGEVFRRLISKLCVAAVKGDTLNYFQPLQLGVGVPGGSEAVLHSFNRAIRSTDLAPDTLLVLVDFVNAFNEVNRQAFLDIVHAKYPIIYPWVFYCYSIGAPLFIYDNVISATTGVQQGDPLGPLLFALVLHPFLESLRDHYSLRIGAILDDVTFLGSPTSSRLALEYLSVEGARSGLRLSPKTCVWSPTGFPIPVSIQTWSIEQHTHVPISVILSKGVPLLGSAVSCDVNFLNATVMKRVQKWQVSLQLMSALGDPQLELMLLRACLGSPKMLYLLRTLPPTIIAQQLGIWKPFSGTP